MPSSPGEAAAAAPAIRRSARSPSISRYLFSEQSIVGYILCSFQADSLSLASAWQARLECPKGQKLIAEAPCLSSYDAEAWHCFVSRLILSSSHIRTRLPSSWRQSVFRLFHCGYRSAYHISVSLGFCGTGGATMPRPSPVLLFRNGSSAVRSHFHYYFIALPDDVGVSSAA